MKLNILILTTLVGTLLLTACSSENSLAPGVNQVHPGSWVLNHNVEANADLTSCQGCHNIDFSGSGNAVSCFSCHADGPPFITHSATWSDVVQDHQNFYTSLSWTQCANAACHGTDMQGGDFGPSCFSSDYLGTSCHAGGPAAPHTLPYQSESAHGPAAKDAQIECRNCHGQPTNTFDGGFVVNILGLDDANGGNCSSCHPQAKAHPVNWQGTNDAGGYASSHQGTFNIACALCHKTDGAGTGPLPPAPSCYSATYQNSTSASALPCHPGGPGVAHVTGADWLLPTAHVAAWQADSPPCFNCHAVTSGGISPTCRSCHTASNPTTNSSGCSSCHGTPPNSGKHNDHDNFSCNTCHFGFGTTSLEHWYPNQNSPADIQLNPSDSQIDAGFEINKDSGGNVTSCAGSCHGDGHGSGSGRDW